MSFISFAYKDRTSLKFVYEFELLWNLKAETASCVQTRVLHFNLVNRTNLGHKFS